MNQALEVKVAARNEVNKAANELRTQLHAFFRERVGKKVIKTTPYRSLTAKVVQDIEPVLNSFEQRGFRIIFDCGYSYSIYCTIRKDMMIGNKSMCFSQDIYACSLNLDSASIKDEWKNCIDYREDFTVEEVLEKRKRIAELDREISELKGSIRDFDRY